MRIKRDEDKRVRFPPASRVSTSWNDHGGVSRSTPTQKHGDLAEHFAHIDRGRAGEAWMGGSRRLHEAQSRKKRPGSR